jgi:hypothetical protein
MPRKHSVPRKRRKRTVQVPEPPERFSLLPRIAPLGVPHAIGPAGPKEQAIEAKKKAAAAALLCALEQAQEWLRLRPPKPESKPSISNPDPPPADHPEDPPADPPARSQAAASDAPSSPPPPATGAATTASNEPQEVDPKAFLDVFLRAHEGEGQLYIKYKRAYPDGPHFTRDAFPRRPKRGRPKKG